jgi:hypothetical protein
MNSVLWYIPIWFHANSITTILFPSVVLVSWTVSYFPSLQKHLITLCKWQNSTDSIAAWPGTDSPFRFFIYFFVSWDGVWLGLLCSLRLIDDDEGIFEKKKNQITRRKPAPVPLCLPRISHDPGSKPRRRGGKPRLKSLRYGTAFHLLLLLNKIRCLEVCSVWSYTTCYSLSGLNVWRNSTMT